MEGPTDRQKRRAIKYSSVGLEYTFTFLAFLAFGLWLDLKLETLPGFLMLFAVMGLAGGLYRLVRQSRQFEREEGGYNQTDEDEDEDES